MRELWNKAHVGFPTLAILPAVTTAYLVIVWLFYQFYLAAVPNYLTAAAKSPVYSVRLVYERLNVNEKVHLRSVRFLLI